jgi:hypothetical protein
MNLPNRAAGVDANSGLRLLRRQDGAEQGKEQGCLHGGPVL